MLEWKKNIEDKESGVREGKKFLVIQHGIINIRWDSSFDNDI